MTSHRRILDRLIAARQGRYREWAVHSYLEFPRGWLPLWSFQGPDCGGSAANVRLWELKAPEGSGPQGHARGIPIEKMWFKYHLPGGKSRHIVLYRLAIEPELIDQLIDLVEVRLNRSAVIAAGLEIHELPDGEGPGIPGASVRLIPRTAQPQTHLFA